MENVKRGGGCDFCGILPPVIAMLVHRIYELCCVVLMPREST